MAESHVKELEECLKNLNVGESHVSEKSEESLKDPSYLKTLKQLECPMTWNINFSSHNISIIDRTQEKLLEMLDEDEELVAWKSFVCNLILCYEYVKKGNFKVAADYFAKCEENLKEHNNSESSPTMGIGIKHVALATKCFLIHEDDNASKGEIGKILPKIVPFKQMSDKDVSSIYCLRGSLCSEYGYEGNKAAVEFYKKGISFYDKCPDWHFLLGRSLGRLRRVDNPSSIPDRTELNALEKAATTADNASFYVALAVVYREAARNVFFGKNKQANLKSIVDTMNKKSLDLTRKVISQNKENPHVSVRCAMTLMKLPYPWRDMQLAGSCITKALLNAPKSPMVNHYAGKFFEANKDYQEARKYYDIAVSLNVYGAEIDSIALEKRLKSSYDPLPNLLKLLEKYREKPRQVSTLCLLGTQSYYVKKDVKKALYYWFQAIEIDISSSRFEATYDYLVKPIKGPIHKVVITEVLRALKSGNIGKEEKEKYEMIIKKYINDAPEMYQAVKEKIFV